MLRKRRWLSWWQWNTTLLVGSGYSPKWEVLSKVRTTLRTFYRQCKRLFQALGHPRLAQLLSMDSFCNRVLPESSQITELRLKDLSSFLLSCLWNLFLPHPLWTHIPYHLLSLHHMVMLYHGYNCYNACCNQALEISLFFSEHSSGCFVLTEYRTQLAKNHCFQEILRAVPLRAFKTCKLEVFLWNFIFKFPKIPEKQNNTYSSL